MARPPVAKLMDYGKFKYESAVKAREARKNQAQTVIKEMKLRPKIDVHDYETKKGHVVRFLKEGDKVKITIMFRGREQSRPEMGARLLQRLAEDVVDLGFVESAPKLDGRNMIMVLGPHKKKADFRAERAAGRAHDDHDLAHELLTEHAPAAAPEAAAPRPATPRPATSQPATPAARRSTAGHRGGSVGSGSSARSRTNGARRTASRRRRSCRCAARQDRREGSDTQGADPSSTGSRYSSPYSCPYKGASEGGRPQGAAEAEGAGREEGHATGGQCRDTGLTAQLDCTAQHHSSTAPQLHCTAQLPT